MINCQLVSSSRLGLFHSDLHPSIPQRQQHNFLVTSNCSELRMLEYNDALSFHLKKLVHWIVAELSGNIHAASKLRYCFKEINSNKPFHFVYSGQK